ncbi:MAG: GNAT family N-acetyltransferase [Alphaproteobacteria bacterium]|nr:GNAT family N-acetyltransferase [Alphaproteobacteria bacterium]
MIKVLKYQDTDRDAWNAFIDNSINGTFLHNRSYMEYHKDRFVDHSLMIYNDKSDLIAVLPGNKHGDTFFSHQGLTYGGLVHSINLLTPEIVDIFDSICSYLIEDGFQQFNYKSIPRQYYKCIHDGDHYALFLKNAVLSRRDVYSVIDLNNPAVPCYGSQRKRAIKKALKKDLFVIQNKDVGPFYNVLADVLYERHQVRPTHTADELRYLMNLFPHNICVFECHENDSILAGVIVYQTDNVVHAQYIANSAEGQDCGALDFLFDYLIEIFRPTHQYFSFGISNEDNGRILNRGLINQKEGFGARSYAHDHYMLKLNNSVMYEK